MTENLLTLFRRTVEASLDGFAPLKAAGIVIRKWDSELHQILDNPVGDMKYWLRVDAEQFSPNLFEYNEAYRLVYRLAVAAALPKNRGLRLTEMEWFVLAITLAIEALSRDQGIAQLPYIEKFDVLGGDFAIIESSVKDKQKSSPDGLVWSSLYTVVGTFDVPRADLGLILGAAPWKV